MLMQMSELCRLLKNPIGAEKLEICDDTNTIRAVGSPEEYKIIDNIPVLVDFKNSVLSVSDVEFRGTSSPITRRGYGGISAFLKRVVNKKSTVTNNNVKIIRELLSEKTAPVVLLVGGGTIGEGMTFLTEDENIKLVSFDIYGSDTVQFVADAHNIPVLDEQIDCVIVQAVLEHVVSPPIVVEEIHRVLKQDGVVYAETPFMQQVHEGAFDFTRYTDSGHRNLFARFELIASGAVSGPGTALLWSIDYFFRSLFRSRRIGKAAKLLFFWVQYFDNIIDNKYAIDAASGVFFYGRKATLTLDAEGIINHYQGAQ